MNRVAIIGGGVIGITTSYFLSLEGYDVTLFEREKLGSEASTKNAGLIVPGMYSPLPLSADLPTIIKWLIYPTSPVKIGLGRPSISWIRYLMKSRKKPDIRKYVSIMRREGKKTMRLFDEIIGSLNEKCSYRKGEILEIYTDLKLFEEAKNYAEETLRDGINISVLNGDELRSLEPCISDKVIGGLKYEDDASVDPVCYIKTLLNMIEERNVNIINKNVEMIEEDDEVTIYFNGQRKKFSKAIVTAGPWTKDILKKMNIHILLEAARGYVVTLKDCQHKLSHPLMVEETKMVVHPYIDRVVLAGVQDFKGYNRKVSRERINKLIKETLDQAPCLIDCERTSIEVAFRPCTPDEIPIIGNIDPFKNIYVATGHCRFGLTYSILTGKLVTKVIVNGKLPDNFGFLKPRRVII